MKKFILRILGAILAFSMVLVPLGVSAANIATVNNVSHNTILLSDGTCIEVTLTIYSAYSGMGTRATNTRSATKTYDARDNVVLKWSYSVHGSFTYNASSSTCTSSSSSRACYDGWSCSKDVAGKSGNTATADGTFNYGLASQNVALRLTCDKDGNVS